MKSRQPLINYRILICGKGGSGKSTITALLGNEFERRGYPVVLLDGDASNPGGLSRLTMGLPSGPRPLIDFFGGREHVTCPVDDPAPLKMPSGVGEVVNMRLDIKSLPKAYYIRKGRKVLLQCGKIRHLLEGCDGPMSKITRDLIFSDDHIMLIDVEAGVEHFGRGVEAHVDIVLSVVDPTFESIEIAGRVAQLCADLGISQVWAVLNAIKGENVRDTLKHRLRKKEISILGVIDYNPLFERIGLEGGEIDQARAPVAIPQMVDFLERSVGIEAVY
jgi:CO dehydrogenase maturation factor